MEWRFVGPYRGGRVTTVAGVPSDPQLYYMGATGGGVWKTGDAGAFKLPDRPRDIGDIAETGVAVDENRDRYGITDPGIMIGHFLGAEL